MFSTLNMKRILVPIDFSDITPRVTGVAQQLATALDTEIHLIHVYNLLVGGVTKAVLKRSARPMLLVPRARS